MKRSLNVKEEVVDLAEAAEEEAADLAETAEEENATKSRFDLFYSGGCFKSKISQSC
jgi:hypothetical protein